MFCVSSQITGHLWGGTTTGGAKRAWGTHALGCAPPAPAGGKAADGPTSHTWGTLRTRPSTRGETASDFGKNKNIMVTTWLVYGFKITTIFNEKVKC